MTLRQRVLALGEEMLNAHKSYQREGDGNAAASTKFWHFRLIECLAESEPDEEPTKKFHEKMEEVK